MKPNFRSFLLILGCIALLFLSCPTESDSHDEKSSGATLTITVSTGSGAKYFSLITGEEIQTNQINTPTWDIGFQRSRLIYTNSGATATKLESHGQGAVWYTEKFVFDEVTSLSDAVTDDPTLLKGYSADVKRWIQSMSLDEVCVNVIGYVGYENEDLPGAGESREKPLKGFQYNKKQFYRSKSYDPSNRVYIIKHGDGKGYSKIQITEYESNPSEKSDTYVIRY
ncbi:MAG: HmuY family protein, partial [Spirochaetaceae bacterium]|nr:HmuY family protein [Spirochaetaceae bacterium]